MAQDKHVAAAKVCVQVISGPDSAVEVLHDLFAALECFERDRVERHEQETRGLMAQLMGARDRTTEFRNQRDALLGSLTSERTLRQDAEADVYRLRKKLQQQNIVVQENQRLRQQLVNAQQRWRAPPSQGEVAQQVAALECEPLRQCSSQDHASIKKRLLLKWHPDKQPSADHACFGTQVMQELQNQPSWTY